MDPFVWGPMTWNLIFDICWRMDKIMPIRNTKLRQHVQVFFQLLTNLLPCPSCCCSYKRILLKLKFPQNNYLHWAYHVKDYVNQKLGKQSPPLEEVQRRMRTMSAMTSVGSIWDLLFIIAFDYSIAHAKAIYILFEVLPDILDQLRIGKPIPRILKRNPIHIKTNLKSRKALVLYLCHISKRNIHQVTKQYSNCCVDNKQQS